MRRGADKRTVYGDAEGYTQMYEMLFEHMRDSPLNLLEIGLEIGGPEHDVPASRDVTDAPSVRMWRSYFPHAKIYGADISDFSVFETE